MKILGIDPGLRKTGWGIVIFENNLYHHVDDGFILQDNDSKLGDKLLNIFNSLNSIIMNFKPDLIGIEQTFVGSGNVSSLKLGMARGVCILAAANLEKKIIEIAPKLVKKNITGSGIASKYQVKQMIKKILQITPKSEDSSDALAVAMSIQAKSTRMNLNYAQTNTNRLAEAIKKALEKEKVNLKK